MIPNRLAFTFLLLAMLIFSAPDIIAADADGDTEAQQSGYPPEMHELVIDSAGSRMAALAYVAAGKGPHPTVILLHGYPGNEKNLDLAQAIRRAGWNVLFFHYRGAWGSEGAFSLINAEADVQAAIDFLRDTRTQEQLRVDPAKLALVGHSMGGHMALAGLTGDSGTICAVSLDGANMGALAVAASQAPEQFEGFKSYTDGLFMLEGWDGAAAQAELELHGPALDLKPRMQQVRQRPVLFIMADSDDVPVDVHAQPLITALKAAGNDSWRLDTIPDDHSFSASRLVLAERVIEFLEEQCLVHETGG